MTTNETKERTIIIFFITANIGIFIVISKFIGQWTMKLRMLIPPYSTLS